MIMMKSQKLTARLECEREKDNIIFPELAVSIETIYAVVMGKIFSPSPIILLPHHTSAPLVSYRRRAVSFAA